MIRLMETHPENHLRLVVYLVSPTISVGFYSSQVLQDFADWTCPKLPPMEMALLVSFHTHTHKWFEMVQNSRNEHVKPLLKINVSFSQGNFEDEFPFPKVGYVTSLEGIPLLNMNVSVGYTPSSKPYFLAGQRPLGPSDFPGMSSFGSPKSPMGAVRALKTKSSLKNSFK